MNRQSALGKAQHYCAYQERSTQEVRNKFFEWEVDENEFDELVKELEDGKYLDDIRFAKAYALGKFRMKNWGKIKITHGMFRKGLTEGQIRLGLAEIDKTEYKDKLLVLIQKKKEIESNLTPLERNHKVSKYLIAQGFEPELVWNVLNMKRD